MKKTKKLILAGALLVSMLVGVGAALAPGDSLLTLSYLKDRFIPSAVTQGKQAGEAKLQETYNQGMAKLNGAKNEISGQTGPGSTQPNSDALAPMDLHDGERITTATGCGVLMRKGVAVVRHNGVFVDVTTGQEIASGSKLEVNHRYITGENTSAEVEVMSGAAQIGVEGAYSRVGGSANPMPFYDISRLDWYYTQVQFVYNKGYFAGTSAHEFGPGVLMNRAMVMTVFYKMAGLPQAQMDAAAGLHFRDVPEDAWYAPYVKWGAAQGITGGTGPDTFDPNALVNREQFVQLLYNFSIHYLGREQPQRADLSAFQDGSTVSPWAKEAVSWGVATEILQSIRKEEKVLMPQYHSDRAAISVMLWNFENKAMN